jgi:hypothetical protein
MYGGEEETQTSHHGCANDFHRGFQGAGKMNFF